MIWPARDMYLRPPAPETNALPLDQLAGWTMHVQQIMFNFSIIQNLPKTFASMNESCFSLISFIFVSIRFFSLFSWETCSSSDVICLTFQNIKNIMVHFDIFLTRKIATRFLKNKATKGAFTPGGSKAKRRKAAKNWRHLQLAKGFNQSQTSRAVA